MRTIPVQSEEQQPIHVLFVTTQWPTPDYPNRAPFVAREVEAIRDAGISVDVLIYEGGWHPVRYVKAVQKFRSTVKKGQYDLIHARFGQCGLVSLTQRRLPVMVMFGGSDVEDTPRRNYWQNLLMRFTSRFVARFADEVVVVSDHLGKSLPRKDYHVISSALDLSLFQPMDQQTCRRKLGLPANKKLVLFAASDIRDKRKRYDLAVEVCKLVGDEIEMVVLTNKSSDQVPIYMNACDVLLMTSTHEGSPNVVKEALACNLPVVSTDVGDVKDRIGHIQGCYVCEDDEPHSIATALKAALASDVPIEGRSTFGSLDRQVFAKKVIDIYQKLLNSPSRKFQALQRFNPTRH